ncbi:ACP S-malonyltransferase [Bermanella sp. R86510]|uniref:ACP S-malonyltransferase n=1 Tax=unclassified Bermanella TaxID=2627862 RepID=UPI0037C8D28A
MTAQALEKKQGWVFVYPGQGSQYIGMAQDIYNAFPPSQNIFSKASEYSGKNIEKLCFNGPISKLSNTDVLQVATTAANLSIDAYLSHKTNIKPDVVLGHSVGEYSALYKAGVISLDDTLKLTAERGRLMQREAKRQKGQMYAIKNTSPEDLKLIINTHFAPNQVVIANDNSPSQQVVSASKEHMAELAKHLSEAAIEYVKLPVSGAWHSPLMQGCTEEYAEFIYGITFTQPAIPLVSNLQAQYVTDPKIIKEDLVSHLIDAVRWRESIKFLLSQGYVNFLEVGPKKVLSRLIDSIAGSGHELNIENVETLSDIDNR